MECPVVRRFTSPKVHPEASGNVFHLVNSVLHTLKIFSTLRKCLILSNDFLFYYRCSGSFNNNLRRSEGLLERQYNCVRFLLFVRVFFYVSARCIDLFISPPVDLVLLGPLCFLNCRTPLYIHKATP